MLTYAGAGQWESPGAKGGGARSEDPAQLHMLLQGNAAQLRIAQV
jgi:hypothetical protein